MKKILFLGACAHQLPPIYYALEQHHRVITCDMHRDRPGHGLAHEAYQVSTTDKEGVLALAQRLGIDAVVAYAADCAAPTAAYVAEQMGLLYRPLQCRVPGGCPGRRLVPRGRPEKWWRRHLRIETAPEQRASPARSAAVAAEGGS